MLHRYAAHTAYRYRCRVYCEACVIIGVCRDTRLQTHRCSASSLQRRNSGVTFIAVCDSARLIFDFKWENHKFAMIFPFCIMLPMGF